MPTDPPLDELLRKYLSTDPGEALAKVRVAVERVAAEQLAGEGRLSATFKETLADHEAKDDARFERMFQAQAGTNARVDRLEKAAPSQRPPTLRDLGRMVTETGNHFLEGELEEAIKKHDAKEALAQKQTVIRAAGKIALAVLTAGAIFAAGTFWRDVTQRPQNQTSITTIAPIATVAPVH